VTFPRISEQERIVTILDQTFDGINTAVANTDKNLANVRELFDSYLNSVFAQKGDGWAQKMLPRCPGWVETSSPCLPILRFLLGSVSQFG
jgi:type I restriction enzyme, S subunit